MDWPGPGSSAASFVRRSAEAWALAPQRWSHCFVGSQQRRLHVARRSGEGARGGRVSGVSAPEGVLPWLPSVGVSEGQAESTWTGAREPGLCVGVGGPTQGMTHLLFRFEVPAAPQRC